MGLIVRVIRGLSVAGLVLAGVLLGSPGMTNGGRFDAAYAQSSAISVEGNRRVEAETIRSYFKRGADGKYDAASCRCWR